MSSEDSGTATNYRVPALEKGLDILECLAAHDLPMTQAALGRALGRGSSELFRMLTTLERRGYLARDPVSGAYSLTLRLYELSRSHSPYEGLLRAAARPMRELATTLRQSCHISVIRRGKLLVLAQEESPAPLRLSVEVGGMFPLLHTVSGRVLLAFLPAQQRQELLAADEDYRALDVAAQADLEACLAHVAERGYETAYSETTEGVSDVAVLVGSASSTIKAALAVPALTRRREGWVEEVLPAVRACADAVARAAGIVV